MRTADAIKADFDASKSGWDDTEKFLELWEAAKAMESRIGSLRDVLESLSLHHDQSCDLNAMARPGHRRKCDCGATRDLAAINRVLAASARP